MKDNKKMEILSKDIAKQISLQHVSSISLSMGSYVWIKQYLEAKIPENIVYNIKASLPLYDIDFKKKLLNNKSFLDKRVKTLLCTYDSQFEL